MTRHVTLFEMGPRDGLQNEADLIATPDKVKLVNLLSDCGLEKIEVTSFVSPKWVPQLADAADVMASITRRTGVSYTALVPNQRGLDAAVQARADEVAVFASASEGFSAKNINCTIADSMERFKPVLESATKRGLPVRGYISCITDCPYDGAVSPEQVTRVAVQLLDLGCYEISLGDTLGKATPETIDRMLTAVLSVAAPEMLAAHLHDTHGRALSNIQVCLDKGISVFDAAVGGLGGCPYAPGAKGNVATESVVALLADQGIDTGIDVEKLNIAARFAQTLRTE